MFLAILPFLNPGGLLAQGLSVVYKTGFDKDDKLWRPTDPSGWKIDTSLTGKPVYWQFRKKSSYRPPVRSPFHISLLQKPEVESFQLDVDVLSTHEDYGHRDACLFFNYQGPERFYYVHLGKKTDDHANQIFIVNKAPRTKISLTTTAGTEWDDKWHHVRIRRDVDTGSIEVYFDDMQKPVMTARDRNFLKGKVGIGSFDDTTAWDNFELRTKKTKK